MSMANLIPHKIPCHGRNYFQEGRHKLKYYCSTIAYEGKYTDRIPGVKVPKDSIEGYVFSKIKKRFGAPERIKNLVRKVNALIRNENKDFPYRFDVSGKTSSEYPKGD